MKDFEFYQDLDLKYPELAICLEDSVDGVAKFYIPVLTPIMDSSEAYDETDNYVVKSNILSDTSAMEINVCTTSNYLELRLPNMQMIDPKTGKIIDIIGTCSKGDIFVVIFIGGDPNKPYILGRYFNAINQ